MSINEIVYYKVGDIVFEIISDLPYQLPDGNALDFRTDKCTADYTFNFQKVSSIPDYTGRLSLVQDVVLGHDLINEKGDFYRGFLWKGQYYDAVLKIEDKQGIISYLSADILAERCQNGFNFFNYLGAECIFLKFNGLFLHSSHIALKNKAVLFSAPSGTGKSTQAELWKEHANAKIINGDRTLLRKKNGKWYAYGCPMCGTSQIHLQGCEPLHSIVMLEQGMNNDLVRLSPKEAFSLLYPQVTVQRWNRQMVMRVMELLEDVINHVPIWKYSCTKTADAVDILKSTLSL